LDMYVDTNFAGTWHQEHSELRDCAPYPELVT
jgi:hypothetical protein